MHHLLPVGLTRLVCSVHCVTPCFVSDRGIHVWIQANRKENRTGLGLPSCCFVVSLSKRGEGNCILWNRKGRKTAYLY